MFLFFWQFSQQQVFFGVLMVQFFQERVLFFRRMQELLYLVMGRLFIQRVFLYFLLILYIIGRLYILNEIIYLFFFYDQKLQRDFSGFDEYVNFSIFFVMFFFVLFVIKKYFVGVYFGRKESGLYLILFLIVILKGVLILGMWNFLGVLFLSLKFLLWQRQ